MSSGDIAYVGIVGPKELPRIAGGKLFLAAGPTMLFPCASEPARPLEPPGQRTKGAAMNKGL